MGRRRHARLRCIFTALDAHANTRDAKRYRFTKLEVLFFRSAKRTPSAYAHDWTVAWNVSGSLNTSADAARETLFHEIFHLNDYAHPVAGVDAWSLVALEGIFSAIVKKCGTATACLTPYTPNDTQVRGGTYYAFQPGNGVREYAAELVPSVWPTDRVAVPSMHPVSPTAVAAVYRSELPSGPSSRLGL